MVIGILLLLLSSLGLLSKNRPNIILVFIDDMGWGDFSCFGNQDASTPHIDRLAKEGIRFEQFYVNSPICSPSRVAISTGQYPQRWKISSYLGHRPQNAERGMAQWLDPKAPMLARALKDSGYTTGHFGKWHMGGQRDVNDAPAISEYGFDQSLTNFEGMGPKLIPSPSSLGRINQNPAVFGTMPNGWEKDISGCNVRKSPPGLSMPPFPLSSKPSRMKNLSI
jgi:arylsulfatase A-like enzyme